MSYTGLGIDVPYVKFGTTPGVGIPTTGASCGDPFALQQMLKDLGYYQGEIDGYFGNEGMKGMRLFAEANGVPYGAGTFPSGPSCQGLIDAWTARFGLPPAPPVPPTSGAPPPPPPPPVPGQVGYSTAWAKGVRVGALQKLAKGQPGGGDRSGGGGALADPVGWWTNQSTTVKAAIIGGGVLAVGAALMLGIRHGGAKTATANKKGRIYASTYCNKGHRLSDGMPIAHECRVLPTKALEAERAGDFEEANQIISRTRPRYSRGVRG